MKRLFETTLGRRRFLQSAAALAGAGALAMTQAGCHPAILRRVRQLPQRESPRHAVWIWQFTEDGDLPPMVETLAAHGLSAMMKTHDGVEWMSRYDPTPGAISGPEQIANVANIFESAGVPFHAWAVVKGVDPVREAQMAADVLAAGARSIVLDLEHHPGFWVGSPADAVRFGQELRARNEFARVDISIDPRPWNLHRIPLHEFVEFTDGIWPQLYWDTYNDHHHINAYTYMGLPPGGNGITPEFLLDTTHHLLQPLDRWIIPVGHGDAAPSDWPRFARRAWQLGMKEVSVWRYGTSDPSSLSYLAANPPGVEPAWV